MRPDITKATRSVGARRRRAPTKAGRIHMKSAIAHRDEGELNGRLASLLLFSCPGSAWACRLAMILLWELRSQAEPGNEIVNF